MYDIDTNFKDSQLEFFFNERNIYENVKKKKIVNMFFCQSRANQSKNLFYNSGSIHNQSKI